MKSKLIGIGVCVMMLATVLPLTALATTTEPETQSAGLFDRTTVRGLVLFRRATDGGKTVHFFALRIHYRTVKISGEHESGVIRMQRIQMPNAMTGFYGRFYICASFRGSLNV
ncbi:MAG: hypothetical protein JXA00_04840 [Candidatus Thermoplasmatota archaeon]|nr:hypothetical protein [Candidatus Thermoplasmatota archaeon]